MNRKGIFDSRCQASRFARNSIFDYGAAAPIRIRRGSAQSKIENPKSKIP
jgi:hypothetical protein